MACLESLFIMFFGNPSGGEGLGAKKEVRKSRHQSREMRFTGFHSGLSHRERI